MDIKCCICNGEGQEAPYKKIGDFSLWRCRKCNLVYFKDSPDGQDGFIRQAKDVLNKREREKVEYWSFPHLYDKHKDVFSYYFAERLSRIKQFKPDLYSLFDIGCGYGFWLRFCKDRGLDVEGMDAAAEAVDYAREVLKLDVAESSLEGYEFKRSYDVMVMCDILEHLPQPNNELKKISQALSDSGVLFIQVPNLLGFKLPLFHGFGLPYHIWQFSVPSLNLLLEKNGFKILKYWTGVLGVIGVYERGGPGILDDISWYLARQFRIGNRLMVLARKV